MKKRFPAFLLTLCLLLTVPAYASQETGFVRSKSYSGQFSDLPAGSVFYENVAALYEYGLSVGQADGTYRPEAPMTVGQIVIFAGRIRSLYQNGDAETGPSAYREADAPAAERYLRYLQAEGVLDGTLDGQLNQAASRAQVAHVLAGILPGEVLPNIHDSLITQAYASRRYIRDVNEYTPYYQDILSLYRRGISAGSDSRGSYLPEAPITRGAAAAMLTRMVDPALRVTPQWTLADLYSAAGTRLSDLVEPGRQILSPATEEEMDQAIRYMLAAGENQMMLYYPGANAARARQVMELALTVVKQYCEQSYNTVFCNYTIAGFVTLVFSAAGAGTHLQEYRDAAMEAAVAVHDEMWESGIITPDMTQYEMARIYYEWVCNHCVYDYQAGDESISHIAYNLFQNGTAVCDGYTGAYNLLLKLEGIDCHALSNDSHIWTVAVLDGTLYHIDTTWGDSTGEISYDYFAMTPEQSRLYHRW